MATSRELNDKIIDAGQLADGSDYHVRCMEMSDVPEALEVWKEVGLYEGLHTIESFLQVDPEGFFVAVRNNDGLVIGTLSGVFVDPRTAFIGLYAVRPKFQGHGIGMRLWQKMLNHVGDRNAGLHAVPKLQKTYQEKAGFKLLDERKIFEYKSMSLRTDDLVHKIDNIAVVPMDENMIDSAIAYDERILFYNRGKLLRAIFGEKDALALAAIDQDNGKIVGYGCIKKNNIDTAMSGPVYAENDAVAELIVFNLITKFNLAQEKGLNMMVPDCNPGAIRIAQKLGMIKHEELPRLFTKNIPDADFDKIYCITVANFSPF
ncbi:uncharacterized protein LOC141855837 [Brevipalpus obovatus]|uniref:uncharacterized protein LOC141855837 n=1 Tax=Brevipalpus obovatus TaxID=246614 RepID=UPI003D9E6114